MEADEIAIGQQGGCLIHYSFAGDQLPAVLRERRPEDHHGRGGGSRENCVSSCPQVNLVVRRSDRPIE